MTGRLLILITVVGHILKLAGAGLLAAALGAQNYDDYAVAVASVVVLSTISELGLGKYGMKLLPEARAASRPDIVRGYLKFSSRVVLGASLFLGLFAAWLETWDAPQFVLNSPIEAMLFLPAAAMTGVVVELCMATKRSLVATMIIRIGVPIVPLAIAVIFLSTGRILSPLSATLAYGGGWVLGLSLSLPLLLRSLTDDEKTAEPIVVPKRWLSSSSGLMLLGFALSWLAEGSILIADALIDVREEVSTYAICVEIGLFLPALVKSLDKMILPSISEAVSTKDHQMLSKIRMRRWRTVAPLLLVYWVTLLIGGRALLGLLGAGYVGHFPALLLTGAGGTCLTLVSLSQWSLAFVRGSKPSVYAAIFATLLMCGLVVVLGNSWGARGAALGFFAGTFAFAVTIHLQVRPSLRRAMQETQ